MSIFDKLTAALRLADGLCLLSMLLRASWYFTDPDKRFARDTYLQRHKFIGILSTNEFISEFLLAVEKTYVLSNLGYG